MPFLTATIHAILQSGQVTEVSKRTYEVPGTKPGKGPRSVDSLRPISLLRAMCQILETAICVWIFPVADSSLAPAHYT